MTKLFLSIGLLVGLLLSLGSLQAQELTATSDTLSLNFGYPVLKTQDDLTFIDENGNDQIDPDEGCLVAFTVFNQSEYLAKGIHVLPSEQTGLAGILLPSRINIGDIPPGGNKKVEIGILGGENLASGTANFSFLVKEEGEGENITIRYSVQVNNP